MKVMKASNDAIDQLYQPEAFRKSLKRTILVAIVLVMANRYGANIPTRSIESLGIETVVYGASATQEALGDGETKATAIAAILSNIFDFVLGYSPFTQGATRISIAVATWKSRGAEGSILEKSFWILFGILLRKISNQGSKKEIDERIDGLRQSQPYLSDIILAIMYLEHQLESGDNKNYTPVDFIEEKVNKLPKVSGFTVPQPIRDMMPRDNGKVRRIEYVLEKLKEMGKELQQPT
jgi:hypothetical protein